MAVEIATEEVLTVTPDEDLNTAMRRFTMKNIDELPVVDPDVIGTHGRRVAELKENG